MAANKKPNVKKALQKAIDIVGLKALALDLDLSYQSIRAWQRDNQMPATEFCCRTNHAVMVEKSTKGQVTVSDLLGCIPGCIPVCQKK